MMRSDLDALRILRQNRVPYHAGENGVVALLRRGEVDLDLLRQLGFRISHHIGAQAVVSYKGNRFALMV